MVKGELTQMEERDEASKVEKAPRASTVGKPRNKTWQKEAHAPLPKWHRHQGSSNDCGPYSVMFVANSLRDAAVIDGDALARRMEGPVSVRRTLIPMRVRGWATFTWGVALALRQEGFRARWRVAASLRDLWANLTRGWATIVLVGEPFRRRNGKFDGWSHYKVLYAWDPEEGFAFVDPYAESDVVYTYQTEQAFLREWTAMGRQLIEVRG